MDEIFTWMTIAYIYPPDDAAPGLKFPYPDIWRRTLKNFVNRGIVFRDVSLTIQSWKSGLMTKKGTKWVWEQKTMQEIISALGISDIYLQYHLRDCTDVNTDLQQFADILKKMNISI